uniref:Uncharacterized protein n=1 Tax=Arundo donax TaxID=35708 RepID=A0A0A9GTT8_ARUDO
MTVVAADKLIECDCVREIYFGRTSEDLLGLAS